MNHKKQHLCQVQQEDEKAMIETTYFPSHHKKNSNDYQKNIDVSLGFFSRFDSVSISLSIRQRLIG